MDEIVRVQILFSKETPNGVFRDCLYKSLDEFAALTEEAKEAEKQSRVDNYLNAVKNATPVEPEEPPLERLQEERANLEAYLSELDAKISTKVAAAADAVAAADSIETIK